MLVMVWHLVFWVICACTTPQPPQSNRLHLTLSNGWSWHPWTEKRHNLQIMQTQTTVTLPKGRPLKGAVLRIDGLWWQGNLWINGQQLPAFTGGLFPVEIPVGKYIKPGNNQITLRVTAPTDVSSRLTGGRLHVHHRDQQNPKILHPPTLILRPESHIKSLRIQHQSSQSYGTAEVQAPRGSKVHFLAVQDGKVIKDFGIGEVIDGHAKSSLREIHARWHLGKPNLFHLVGVLYDKGGQEIDFLSIRTGAQNSTYRNGRIYLHGQPLPLMAARLSSFTSEQQLTTSMSILRRGGVNAIEFHGDYINEALLDILDENAVPTIIVPRCIGRSNRSTQGSFSTTVMAQQDMNLLRSITHHPAIQLLAIEGKFEGVQLWSEQLTKTSLPIAGLHFPTSRIRMPKNLTQARCLPATCNNSWLLEVTTPNQSQLHSWQKLTNSYETLVQSSIVGAVIPIPNLSMNRINTTQYEQWASAWKQIAHKMQIPQLPNGPFRASSQISITNAPASQSIILKIPYLVDRGMIVDRTGKANFTIWHQGSAQLLTKSKLTSIQVKAQEWLSFQRSKSSNTFSLPP